MTGLRVRPAEPADFPAVARLTVAAYEADGQLKGEHGYGEVLADVSSRAASGEVLVAVDEVTDAVLGSVTFVLPGTPFAELSGPGEAEFRMLAVDPGAQGRGVGAALAQACVARAVELGCTALVICVRAGMADSAHRLYSRLGFVRAPEKDWAPAAGVDLLGLRLALTRG
ncbi:GNAT family N-acetyltransferase [Micromonospora zamorensis]|uniref:GNAT family N-acetyltransferase n=1 Tax=Micromonospora zamorensis TaxID=709883 RepID=A0ABZ1PHC2_9ACTN|nr:MULTISPECIES: GNAT family N-acetyltransferase [Micromonospora]MBQ0978884.1 GNAT family N-acetyltransferase [Micromonospora sp. M61]TQJ24910.1 ribosomal protein S18 acetylase RimI-like enzyme [Micromonospora sp. A202]WSK50952.1 GNAT family N-acetyltransferase [Micromonospora zamorensis]WTE86494.1 GNAT family N-acetyltransferase [Micromonospora zamorensis]SCG63239.1 Ribosomal protein S18 acetylase RimI [Micromonospora zamorensis]